MDRSLWEITSDIWWEIKEHQKHTTGGDDRIYRLMKLAEETGEVSSAYIGYMGANKRKGETHTRLDVAKEIADVIVTGMVALEDWVEDPAEFFGEFLLKLEERVKEQGS